MDTQTLKMTLNHPAFYARILHPFCELANFIPIFLKAQEYLRPKTFNCKGIQAWSEVHLNVAKLLQEGMTSTYLMGARCRRSF